VNKDNDIATTTRRTNLNHARHAKLTPATPTPRASRSAENASLLCVYRKRLFLFLHFRPTKKPKNQKIQKVKKSKPIITINITINIVLDLPSSLGRPPSVRDEGDDDDEGGHPPPGD
jgi:hypothetical protein